MLSAITLRQIVFTGHAVEPAHLSFEEGLNIVYGASNTGKSFIAKTVSFMLGASTALPKIEEIAGYDAVWLGLTLPGYGEITLFRAVIGGNFKFYEGLVTSAPIDSGEILRPKHDGAKTDTVSHRILEAIGLSGRRIVKNANAEKFDLSTRYLMPYVVVSEERILSEKSPVLYSAQYAQAPFEKNLLRLLLTGSDDSAAVTQVSKKVKTVKTAAKVELVDEMIAQIDFQLGEEAPSIDNISAQINTVDDEVNSLHGTLISAQRNIDTLIDERRQLDDSRREISARVTELDVTLVSFEQLNRVYESDISRLESIEEGGLILSSMADRDCQVCGAPPGAQQHHHASEKIEQAYRSASAEREKILVEQRELKFTKASLVSEASGLSSRVAEIRDNISETEAKIKNERPMEASLRSRYETLSSERQELKRILELYQQRDRLSIRRSQIQQIPKGTNNVPISVGIDGTTAYEFSETVRDVLGQWNFPDADKAQFDVKSNDIAIAGKLRADNGKGVRAILHAAFNVSVLIFCKKNNLPHPGILILDTPLLTYREPLTSKYGELSRDEQELKKTNLATCFYRHLASLKNTAQIIILENADVPSGIESSANFNVFTGQAGNNRYGLFPTVKNE